MVSIIKCSNTFVDALRKGNAPIANEFLMAEDIKQLRKIKTETGSLLDGFLSMHMSSPIALQVARAEISDHNGLENGYFENVLYRRLSKSRFQALVETSGDLAFLWESLSADRHNHHFLVCRLLFKESEDDPYYWVPWHQSLTEAEAEYCQVKSLNSEIAKGIKSRFSLGSEEKEFAYGIENINDEHSLGHVGVPIPMAEEDDDDPYWSQYSQIDVY